MTHTSLVWVILLNIYYFFDIHTVKLAKGRYMIHSPLGFTTDSLTNNSISAGFILSQQFPGIGYSFMYNVFSRNVYISKELIRDIVGLNLIPKLINPQYFSIARNLNDSRELFIKHTEIILSNYSQLDTQYHIHEQLTAINIFNEAMPPYFALVDFTSCIDHLATNYESLNISHTFKEELTQSIADLSRSIDQFFKQYATEAVWVSYNGIHDAFKEIRSFIRKSIVVHHIKETTGVPLIGVINYLVDDKVYDIIEKIIEDELIEKKFIHTRRHPVRQYTMINVHGVNAVIPKIEHVCGKIYIDVHAMFKDKELINTIVRRVLTKAYEANAFIYTPVCDVNNKEKINEY